MPNLYGAELFDVGRHKGENYNLGHIKRLADNFARLKVRVPVVLGHSEDQPILTRAGFRDAGHVENVRRRWTKLIGDFVDVPEAVAKLINQRAYSKVSCELFTDPVHRFADGSTVRGPILRRVALLGGEVPQVKSLADLPPCTHFSEGNSTMPRFDTRGRRFTSFEDSPSSPDSARIPEQQLASIVKSLQSLIPGIDPRNLTPDVLAQMAAVLAPLTGSAYSDAFGPGANGAGIGDKKFSDRSGITRISMNCMSPARRAHLLGASVLGAGRRVLANERRR
jgi:hypothetical protein